MGSSLLSSSNHALQPVRRSRGERGTRFLLLPLLLTVGCAGGDGPTPGRTQAEAGDPPAEATAAIEHDGLTITAGTPFEAHPRETRFRNVRQLTFEGENAEAYFSFDGTKLVFQRTPAEGGCDQIYTIDLATGETALVSSGEGRTTCSYYYPAGDRILYASTHHHDASCPTPPDMSRGYVWAVYPTYDLFVTSADGSGELVQLTDTYGYDAEATVSPTGERIVFTSMRDGDLDLYSMRLDGSDVQRLTDREGYDGGAFYSPDGSRIVWRAHYPETEEELADYRALLADGLIRPTTLDIWVADADGSNARKVTDDDAANFGPFWHPSGEKIVFSSNMGDPAGRDFDLYLIGVDGTGLERITFTPDFDGFPMFSPDGRYFVWGSNRNPSHDGNTNVFIAEWLDAPPASPESAGRSP